MKTVIIKIVSFRKGDGVIEETKRMPRIKANKVMYYLVEQYKQGGYQILNTVRINGRYRKFNALLIKDGEPIEYHTYEVEI